MTYNLFDLTYRVASKLGDVVEGLATGGSATTIIDATRLLDQYPDDWFNLGTAWILRDSAGGGSAPQGKFARISDFAKSSGTVTMETVTTAVAAGDRYAIATGKYPLDQIIAKINEALDETPVKVSYITLWTTADHTTEYTLPAEMLDSRIDVWIQGQNETNDNRWLPWHDWYIQETGIGWQKKLVFRSQPPNDYQLKVEYLTPHPPLYVYNDKLDESADINRVTFDAAHRLLLWKIDQAGDTDPDLLRRLEIMDARLERARWRHPAPQTGEVKLATIGFVDNEIEDEE